MTLPPPPRQARRARPPTATPSTSHRPRTPSIAYRSLTTKPSIGPSSPDQKANHGDERQAARGAGSRWGTERRTRRCCAADPGRVRGLGERTRDGAGEGGWVRLSPSRCGLTTTQRHQSGNAKEGERCEVGGGPRTPPPSPAPSLARLALGTQNARP